VTQRFKSFDSAILAGKNYRYKLIVCLISPFIGGLYSHTHIYIYTHIYVLICAYFTHKFMYRHTYASLALHRCLLLFRCYHLFLSSFRFHALKTGPLAQPKTSIYIYIYIYICIYTNVTPIFPKNKRQKFNICFVFLVGSLKSN